MLLCWNVIKFIRREIVEIVRYLPDKKISSPSQTVATARIAPKVLQGQPPTFGSQWWWWLLICIAHYAKRLYCATCPGALWKAMFSTLQCRSKRSNAERWVAEMIRQDVPDHRTCHGESPTSEPTTTITWYDQLMASGRSEMLTTGNVWCRNATVDQVLWRHAL